MQCRSRFLRNQRSLSPESARNKPVAHNKHRPKRPLAHIEWPPRILNWAKKVAPTPLHGTAWAGWKDATGDGAPGLFGDYPDAAEVLVGPHGVRSRACDIDRRNQLQKREIDSQKWARFATAGNAIGIGPSPERVATSYSTFYTLVTRLWRGLKEACGTSCCGGARLTRWWSRNGP